ncbi:proteophosphoglycan 5 [Rhodotorula toruloides]|uniref:Proteophosphoglycan 5 n=1 Tax=Rhodotorula toruloides TaxID=5286 RepID=A0A511KBG2_RHOTO|nr:proteophosphoglycan 5 [Rhodotorula toruloides]
MLVTSVIAAAALAHTAMAYSPLHRDAPALARRQDSTDPVEQLAMVLLSFGVNVSDLKSSDQCAAPCLTDWANGVDACSTPDKNDVKTNVQCACTDGNVALLQKCTNCMGGENVQIGNRTFCSSGGPSQVPLTVLVHTVFAQQCPVAVEALATSSVAGSQASSTGGLPITLPSATGLKSTASSVLSSATSDAASAAHTSAVAAHSTANGTSQPAPGSAAKTFVPLLSVSVVGLAVLFA